MKKAFAIMPFGGIEDDIYQITIKPLFDSFGIQIIRADENLSSTSIIKELLRQIDEADIILADITKHNANVFYELAVAHSLNKPTIMITRDIDNMPFDLRPWRSIVYTEKPAGINYLEIQIKAVLDLFKIGRYVYSNPVIDSLTISPFASVLRTEEIILIEQNAKKLVCVIAPDIEIGPSDFAEVMKSNITDKGIEYRYLISDEPSVISDFKEFASSLDLGERQYLLKGKSIETKYIESDVTLIDPKKKYEFGFILAPPEQPDFHFKLIGSNLLRIKERFNHLWVEGVEINILE